MVRSFWWLLLLRESFRKCCLLQLLNKILNVKKQQLWWQYFNRDVSLEQLKYSHTIKIWSYFFNSRYIDGNVSIFTAVYHCKGCLSLACLSFHQASVDLSTSGDVSACQPLLWGICQEGTSSISPNSTTFKYNHMNVDGKLLDSSSAL